MDAAATTTAADPRTRILDAALALMSVQGSAGASMRQLASACGMNVATIYHYFPSKADLLRSVIEERRYGERLGTELPYLDASVPPRERFTGLFEWLWANALEEEAVWRLLIGEALRGEEAATSSAAQVVGILSTTLEAWLRDGFPELTGDRDALSHIIRGQVFALVVEHLALGEVTPATARERAEALATLFFP
jgi:AcrR family transcriptional regulator